MITEESLHDLARKTMDAISPDVKLSLDEFIHLIPMTEAQLELCQAVLDLFYANKC